MIIFIFIRIFINLNLFYTFKFVNFLFKIDVVIFVKQTNLFKQKIQFLKRWKFNIYNCYIRDDIIIILNVFKKF